MKKYIRLLIVIIILICIFIYFKNKAINYEIDYVIDDYQVKEKYDKKNKYYSYTVDKDEYTFYFAINHSYLSKRKLVNKVNSINNDDQLCINVETKIGNTETICEKNKEYENLSLKEDIKYETIDNYEDIKIYDKSYEYYEWNGYGLTNIVTKKEYKVLEKESYNNSLSYKYDNYVLFANYDEKNEFNKFYIFNVKTKKFNVLKLKKAISYDSYFQGVYKEKIYLFDRNKSTQYSIDLKKKQITKTSDSEGAIYFDGEVSHKPLNNFKYNDLYFKNTNTISFYIENNILYYSYLGSDIKIKMLSNVQEILSIKDDKVIYLSDGIVYEDGIKSSMRPLLESMEWQFHNSSIIYVF